MMMNGIGEIERDRERARSPSSSTSKLTFWNWISPDKCPATTTEQSYTVMYYVSIDIEQFFIFCFMFCQYAILSTEQLEHTL